MSKQTAAIDHLQRFQRRTNPVDYVAQKYGSRDWTKVSSYHDVEDEADVAAIVATGMAPAGVTVKQIMDDIKNFAAGAKLNKFPAPPETPLPEPKPVPRKRREPRWHHG